MTNAPQLSEDQIRELLKGAEDILTPAVRGATPAPRACPNCKGRMIPIVDSSHPFTEGKITPNYVLDCPACHMRLSVEGSVLSTPFEPLDL